MNEIFDRVKRAYRLANDAELARHLGMRPSALSMNRARNTVPYAAIIERCAGSDLNRIFLGTAPAQTGTAAEKPEAYGDLKAHLLSARNEIDRALARLED